MMPGAEHTLTASPTFRSLLLSLPARLMTRLSPSLSVKSLPAESWSTNVLLSALIDLILPPAAVSAAAAVLANRAIASVALSHFERHIIMKLLVWNLLPAA